MGAFQTIGCLSALIRAVFITECLLTNVRGDGADSEEKLDFKYVLIGSGIGLFLVAGFIMVKVCIIRKQIREENTDVSMKRHSEPQLQLLALSRPRQSEHPVPAVSNDMQC
ncbi:transmembrane protein 273-like isoform 1-T1 [Symphorus nematophorus]